jgi:signal transduction histidine kinase
MALRTKLVFAITAMVAALVGAFAYLYIVQSVRSRISEAYADGDFVAHEVFNSARQSLEAYANSASVDVGSAAQPGIAEQPSNAALAGNSVQTNAAHPNTAESGPARPDRSAEQGKPVQSGAASQAGGSVQPGAPAESSLLPPGNAAQPANPGQTNASVPQALQNDSGLNSLLQSIVGYSPIVYDVAIADSSGRALLHTDPDMIGKQLPNRPNFNNVRHGKFWDQIALIYGKPRIYEIRMPIMRDDQPFGDIRVSLSTTLLKNELKPQLDRSIAFSMISIIVSLLLAAVLSNFALRPLEAIGQRLDRLSAGEVEPAADTRRTRRDEYGVVTTKIDRLGRQMRDVKEVFSALKENLDQIMANLQDGLMLFTRDSRAVLVSASVEQFVGRPRGQILGSRVDEIFSRETPLGRAVLDAFDRHLAIDTYETENAAGRRVQISIDFIAERGERIGALLTMRDAESVRRIEDEIELSRRLAAIGRLTSGVAHEVKNPINAIVVHLEVLREKLIQLDPDTRRRMDIISSEIHRLDRVVQTLVDFTRPVELKLADIDLRTLLDETLLLAEPEAHIHAIDIERDFAATPLVARIDADLVKQAVLNVVLNGVQAMPHGGVLVIRAFRHEGSAQIEISDRGVGIAPEIRDKIFNLYFTTKKQGSGIGLAMTYRVVQLHNGSVDLESVVGEGTTFRLRFPLLETWQESAQEASAQR